MHFVNRLSKFGADALVVLDTEFDDLILASLVTVKTVFKSKRMCDLELLPRHDSSRSNFVRFYLKAAVFDVEHVCLLSENTRQQSDDCPAQEPTVSSCVASVEECVLLF